MIDLVFGLISLVFLALFGISSLTNLFRLVTGGRRYLQSSSMKAKQQRSHTSTNQMNGPTDSVKSRRNEVTAEASRRIQQTDRRSPSRSRQTARNQQASQNRHASRPILSEQKNQKVYETPSVAVNDLTKTPRSRRNVSKKANRLNSHTKKTAMQKDLLKGIVYKEILDKPKSLQSRR